jgi:hypothetical protein
MSVDEHSILIKIFEWLGGIALTGLIILWKMIGTLRSRLEQSEMRNERAWFDHIKTEAETHSEFVTKEEHYKTISACTERMVDKINGVEAKVDLLLNYQLGKQNDETK